MVAKKPMMNEPETLTKRVPHGKVWPIRPAIALEAQYRPTPPMALPIAIKR
jgi:hypothetical protein